MLVDIESQYESFISEIELQVYVKEAKDIGLLIENIIKLDIQSLGKLDDLVFVGDELYFKEDAEQIFGNDLNSKSKRDSYLHRLYKNELKEESVEIYGNTVCLEKISYPVLIASHIKPF